MTIETVAGPSTLVAAIATVVGAVTLGRFLAKGQPWGTWLGLDIVTGKIGFGGGA